MANSPLVECNNEQWLGLWLDEPVVAALARMNVFLGNAFSAPVNSKKYIRIHKDALIEEYTSFKSEGLYSRGALSYSEAGEWRFSCGRYCSIAGGTQVFGERHPVEWVTSSAFTYCYLKHWNKPQFYRFQKDVLEGRYPPEPPEDLEGPFPVIGHDVWIGKDAMLARGITIGHGSVIAARAVVTHDVPPYTIVGGLPAKPMRSRFAPEVAEALLATEWWNYSPEVLYLCGFKSPETFIKKFAELKAQDVLPLWQPRRYTWQDFAAEAGI